MRPLREALAAEALGSFALAALFPGHPTLGATLPAGSWIQSFALEALMSAFLMLVVLRVSSRARETGLLAGMAVGGVVALEALLGGTISGASMNPARSLAPALVAGRIEHLAVCLTAPASGALLAVPACNLLGGVACCGPGGGSASGVRA